MVKCVVQINKSDRNDDIKREYTLKACLEILRKKISDKMRRDDVNTNISGYGKGWLMGIENTGKYPDRTMSEKEWKKYLAKIDAVEETIRQQIKEEGKQNQARADESREDNRAVRQEEWEASMMELKQQRKELLQTERSDYFLFVQEEEVVEDSQNSQEKEWVPYSEYMEDGRIVYNGVAFTCNAQEHSICLGDMSDPRKVVTIPLSGGGILKVNRKEIGSLGKAMGMFSAEDVGNILRALEEDKQIQANRFAIEEEENDTMVNIAS